MAPKCAVTGRSAALWLRSAGFVTRGGAPRAVLRADGETWVSGVGDRVGGYVVTAIDDESVRLRRPDGEELVLHAAS